MSLHTMTTAAKRMFDGLHKSGKSAALDINLKTGELICNATKSVSGEMGNGTPGIPYTDDWMRIIETKSGVLFV